MIEAYLLYTMFGIGISILFFLIWLCFRLGLRLFYYMTVFFDNIVIFGFIAYYFHKHIALKISSGKAVFWDILVGILVLLIYNILFAMIYKKFTILGNILNFIISYLGAFVSYASVLSIFIKGEVKFLKLLNNEGANIIANLIFVLIIAIFIFNLRRDFYSRIIDDITDDKLTNLNTVNEYINNDCDYSENYSYYNTKEDDDIAEDKFDEAALSEYTEAKTAFYLDNDDYTLEEIKKIRNRLIKACHSDNNNSDELSKNQSIKINKYYEILKKYCI